MGRSDSSFKGFLDFLASLMYGTLGWVLEQEVMDVLKLKTQDLLHDFIWILSG